MAHNMGQATGVVMLVMMMFMGALSLAVLSRAFPAAWRARIRHAVRRPVSPSAGTGTEVTR